MNFKYYHGVFIWIMILVCSCTPEPLPKPNPCKLPDCSDTIKYVWKRPDSLGLMKILWYTLGHSIDTGSTSDWCYAVDDGVISICQSAYGMNKPYVRKLDQNTGKELWYWDGMPVDHYTDVGYYPDRNLIYVKNRRYDAVINTVNGEILNNTTEPYEWAFKNIKGAIIGDYYYTSVYQKQPNVKDTGDYAQLIRIPIGTENAWEKVYTLWQSKVNGYSPNIGNIALWINPHTLDSIILLNVRMYHWERAAQGADPSTLERSDVVAYNLSKRKVEWTIDSICKVSEVGENFKLDGNIMYFNTGDRFLKIDLLNPKQILYSYDMFGGYAIIDKSNDRMFGLSLGISSVALSHKQVNWKYDNPGFAAKGLELFEGYIYTVNEHYNLMVFNAGTGKIVFQHFSEAMFVPQSVLGMMGRCSVDKKNRLLYCSDRYGVYCLKLPDKWE